MAKIQIVWAAYRKTDWVNDMPPSIDDYNLDKMEEGIYQNSLHIKELIDICTRQDEELDAIRDDIAGLTNRMTTAENDIKGLKNDVNRLDTTKANKADVPTVTDFNNGMDKKLDKTTFDSFKNNLPNTYYNKTEIDNLLKKYLRKDIDDTKSGKLTVTGDMHVNGQISTNQQHVRLAGNNLQLVQGSAVIYA